MSVKIPKYVQKMIDDRYKYACKLINASANLDEWLDNHGIICGDDYTCTGCMIYCEPWTARQCVENDIINHKEG